MKKKPKPVRTYVNSNGYLVLTNRSKQKLLHRLIASATYGIIPKGFQIHHKDGNKLNNDPSNLEVLSPKEHAQRHQTWKSKPRDTRGRFATTTQSQQQEENK